MSCPSLRSHASTAATVSQSMNRRSARPSGSRTASSSTPAAPAGGSGGAAAVLGLVSPWAGMSLFAAEDAAVGIVSSRTPDFRFVEAAAVSVSSASSVRRVTSTYLVWVCTRRCIRGQTQLWQRV